MSYGFLLLLVDVALIVHAVKTGRSPIWVMVILMLPGIGALTYGVVEMLPGLMGSPGARKAQASLAKSINPTKRYHELKDQLAVVDTIANRSALAGEALDLGKNDEALAQYRAIVAMPMGDEPAFYLGLARAQFATADHEGAVKTLEEIKARWPDYTSPDGHLLYARALEGAGRNEEALANYADVASYYPGVEPKARQAQLLAKLGQDAQASALAGEVVASLTRAPRHVRDNQREWLAVARQLSR